MKKKILLIVNPKAGINKDISANVRLFEQLIDKTLFDISIVTTSYSGHASELSKEAAFKNYDIVSVMGGDGTVSEAGRWLINSNTAFSIIPAGSGNGFARNLNIPLHIPDAIKLINNPKIITIDTAQVNGVPFLNIAGTGFDAYVGYLFNTSATRGLFTYVKIISREIFQYQPKLYIVESNGIFKTYDAYLICFANAAQYGYNAVICPDADFSDGLVDVCIIKKFPLWKIPFVIYHLFNGSINKMNCFEKITTKKALIKCTNPDYIHFDGEIRKCDDELQIEIIPHSLKVIVKN